jgi:uncharacterized protein YjbJ (UPF0337 family)
MDKNRKEGAKHEIKGTVKEMVGKITYDLPKEIAGKLEKNLGKVQKEAGKASDAIRIAANDS